MLRKNKLAFGRGQSSKINVSDYYIVRIHFRGSRMMTVQKRGVYLLFFHVHEEK